MNKDTKKILIISRLKEVSAIVKEPFFREETQPDLFKSQYHLKTLQLAYLVRYGWPCGYAWLTKVVGRRIIIVITVR